MARKKLPPTTPGEVLLEEFLKPLEISQYQLANDNLPDHVLEVYRQPIVDVAAPYGFRYGSIVTLRGGDSVSPLALPSAHIAVADLLP